MCATVLEYAFCPPEGGLLYLHQSLVARCPLTSSNVHIRSTSTVRLSLYWAAPSAAALPVLECFVRRCLVVALLRGDGDKSRRRSPQRGARRLPGDRRPFYHHTLCCRSQVPPTGCCVSGGMNPIPTALCCRSTSH